MSNFTFNFSISYFQQIASVAHGTWIVCRRSFIFAKRPREVNVSLRNDAKPDKSSLCWNSYFVAGHLCTQLETVNFLFKTIFEIFQKVRWVSSQFFLLRLLEFNPSNAYFAVTSCTSGLNSGISELLTSDTTYLLCTSNIRSHTATFATLIAFKTYENYEFLKLISQTSEPTDWFAIWNAMSSHFHFALFASSIAKKFGWNITVVCDILMTLTLLFSGLLKKVAHQVLVVKEVNRVLCLSQAAE